MSENEHLLRWHRGTDVGAPWVRSKLVREFLGVSPWPFSVPTPRPGRWEVGGWISSFPHGLSPHDQECRAACRDASLLLIIPGWLPGLNWALSPYQKLKLSTLRWLQLKLTLISENIDRNLNVTWNMGCISPSMGVFVWGGGGQHLTLAARSKGVTNTLNIFALNYSPPADFVSSTFKKKIYIPN